MGRGIRAAYADWRDGLLRHARADAAARLCRRLMPARCSLGNAYPGLTPGATLCRRLGRLDSGVLCDPFCLLSVVALATRVCLRAPTGHCRARIVVAARLLMRGGEKGEDDVNRAGVVLAVVVMLTSFAVTQQPTPGEKSGPQVSDADREGITRAALDYAESYYEGDGAKMERA